MAGIKQIKKGYIQVYTGNGKGKTTASIGLAVRAAGAGLRVFIGQFGKRGSFSECKTIKLLGNRIKLVQFGSGKFLTKNENIDYEKKIAREGLKICQGFINSGKYGVVILDEINVLIHFKIMDINEVLKILEAKPKHVEIVLTGRYAPVKIRKKADLVTDMKSLKHYYDHGVKARFGIDM